MRRLAATLFVALLAPGCGGGDDRPRAPAGQPLRIYTSLPRDAADASAAAAVLEGQRLALADRGGQAAGRRIELVALDSSRPRGLAWTPALVERNAERAADDRSAVAYLGELDHGGSAISVPVTNDAGLLQIAPMDGLTSLTLVQPGGPRGGPERFYPRGRRTFLRLVPTDLSVATAIVDWARQRGAERIAIVHDDRVHGRALAAQAVFVADDRDLRVVAVREVEAGDKPSAYADTAEALADEDKTPDAVVYAGLAQETAEPLLNAVGRELPEADLYTGGLPPDRPLRGLDGVRIVAAVRPPRYYPPGARRVLDRLRRANGGEEPAVAALYGYESMRLALDAIDSAGARAGDRAAVARAALRRGPRPGSVLGDLTLTAAGDVADQRVATYRRDGERLTFEGLRIPDPPELPPAPGDPSS